MSIPTTPLAPHFFQSASNIDASYSTMIAISVISSEAARVVDHDNLRLLDAEVATNAILNSGGRADVVGCAPGTREEIISKMESWIVSGYRTDRRIFWLNGPAGAGKSAIIQSLAELCSRCKIPMANFFFFRADISRNHSRPAVATLLHQILELVPALRYAVSDVIGQDRLIFRKSLREQFMRLLDSPMRNINHQSTYTPPVVLLIDGVDECDSRPDLDAAAKSEQTELLNVLHDVVTAPGSPFIAVVASRLESHIEMTFNRFGCNEKSIHLSDDYQSYKDIRHYITTALDSIKRSHPLGRHLGSSWPSELIVDTIVRKSSGQFIYAATAVRFIANSAQCPTFSMEMVLSVRPARKHSPFAEIDAIYSFILSRCVHWDVVRNIIAAHRMCNIWQESVGLETSSRGIPLSMLGYSQDEAASYFADLTPIIKTTTTHEITLHYHHASFLDFLYSSERAGKFHVDITECANTLAPRLIARISDHVSFMVAAYVFMKVDRRSEALTQALKHLSMVPLETYEAVGGIWAHHFDSKVQELALREARQESLHTGTQVARRSAVTA